MQTWVELNTTHIRKSNEHIIQHTSRLGVWILVTAVPYRGGVTGGTDKGEGEEVKDVMIDFETLGNGKNAAVVQVGACYFDRGTGKIGGVFKRNIDARSAIKSGNDPETYDFYFADAMAKLKEHLEVG